ncbi:MAG TPA: hypothetical protein VHK69_21130 [Chitinophagaceae bacterium]|jgi:hypothetical protein|nr:hypothetical protein [Chitinophagaceae bacterium]
MKKATLIGLASLLSFLSSGQKTETVYLDARDSTSDMYIAVLPEKQPVKAFMVLLDGFGAAPKDLLDQTAIPATAARKGILTIVPVLKTGPLYFGIDSASQQSLDDQIKGAVAKYHLQGKPFYIGGLSIGGSCAVKYAERAAQNAAAIKPKAVFAVDPPLDFEHFYNGARRVVRLSVNTEVNGEVRYMIERIEKEMGGTPATARERYHHLSPYSFSDTTQRAVRTLVHTPLMLITEPDIQWWLTNRGYDFSYLNVTDHAAMINELQRLGNKKAVLVTTHNKGYRQPGNLKHPHSWSIADPEQVLSWLLAQ